MVDLLPYLGSDDMRTFVKRIKAVNAAKAYDPPYLALVFKVLAAYDRTPKKYKDFLKVRTLTDVFWSILFEAPAEGGNGNTASSDGGSLDILALSYFKEVMSLELFYPLRNSYLEECISNLKENNAIARTIYLMKLMLDTYKKKGDLAEVMNAMNSDFNPKILDYLTGNIVFIASDGRLTHQGGGKSSASILSSSSSSSSSSVSSLSSTSSPATTTITAPPQDNEGEKGASTKPAKPPAEEGEGEGGKGEEGAAGDEVDKKEHLVHIFNLVSYLFCYSRGTCFTAKQTEQLLAAAAHSPLLKEVFLSWFLENALTAENIKYCVGGLRFDDDNPSNGGKFTPKAFHTLLDSLGPELLSLSNTDAVVAKRNLSIFYRLFVIVNGLKKLLKRDPQQTGSNEDFLRSFHATTSFDLL